MRRPDFGYEAAHPTAPPLLDLADGARAVASLLAGVLAGLICLMFATTSLAASKSAHSADRR